MASVSLQIGGNNIPVGANLKDLSQASSDLAFIVDGALQAALQKPLSSLKDGDLGTITLDAGNPSWTIAGSPATFSLQAKAIATISLQSKGGLFSYYVDFENTNQQSVPAKSGSVYLVTKLQFNISGNLKANAPVGATGVTVTASSADSAGLTIANYKAFDPATTLQDALLGALAGFTLPLHPNTATNLTEGDAIFYQFDGSIAVGFGVNYGITGSVGGYSLADIVPAVKQFGDVASKQPLTAKAEAGVSISFNWSRTFECFLWRDGANSATLHLSKGTDSKRSVGITADGGITQISAPKLTQNFTTTLASAWYKKLTGKALSGPGQTLQTDVTNEVQKYVDDANNWLSGLAQKVQNHGEVSLSLLFESSTQFASAFTWEFDLSSPQFQACWQDAVNGDFVAALATGAATLAAGSGFESIHESSTKATLTLFGLATFTSLDQYYSNSSLRYGSNGTFYLETKVGKVASSSDKKGSTSTEIYFDGTAQLDASGNVTGAQIQLHGILTAKAENSQTSRFGNLLQSLGQLPSAGSSAAALLDCGTDLKNLATQSGGGTTSVQLVFDQAALGRLRADPYINNKQAAPPYLLDRANWAAYTQASDNLPTDPSQFLAGISSSNLPNYRTYDEWANFNRVTNGFTDGSGNLLMKTDRHSFTSTSTTGKLLEEFWGAAITDMIAFELAAYFTAGQHHMNLCDDVRSAIADATKPGVNWTAITGELQAIVKDDVDAWFGPTVLLAIAISSSATLAIQQQKFTPSSQSATVVVSAG
jgi:hypothetical protein